MSVLNAHKVGRVRAPGPTSGPVLNFNLFEEIRRLESEQPWQAEHTANTIVKYPDLRIVLVALKAGGKLQEHSTSGRISIQTLAGKLKIHACNGIIDMPVGHLTTLDHDLIHDVVAEEDSVFLLTIVLPRGKERFVETRIPAEAFSYWMGSMQESGNVVPINNCVRHQRELGLDETLAETFPCSDAISSLPNPVLA